MVLVMAKTRAEEKKELVIAGSPIPAVKLSILTDRPKRK